MAATWRKTLDAPLIIFGIMWLLGSSSFVWVEPFIRSPNAWVAVHQLLPTWLIQVIGLEIVLLGLPLLIGLVTLLQKRSSRELLAATPAVATFALLVPLLVLEGVSSLRAAFTLFFLAGSLSGYVAVLYIEDLPMHLASLDLLHRRYLEYLRSFLWLAGFFTVGYLAWEIQATTKLQDPVAPAQWPWVIGFLQLAATVGIGVAGMIYAFHKKFMQIEQQMRDIGA